LFFIYFCPVKSHKMNNRIFLLLLLFSILKPVYTQSVNIYEIYFFEWPKIFDNERTLKDTIVLYEDSTFKYSGHYHNLGIRSEFSEGTYSKNDSCIILNSFLKYKRDFKVIERKQIRNGTKYKQKRNCYPFFYNPYIYEFNSVNQKIIDTLSFPFYEYEVDSYNNDAIGFILYDELEYVGEYIFKSKNNRKIIIKIGPDTYGHFYFKNEIFKIEGDSIIRERFNHIYKKQ